LVVGALALAVIVARLLPRKSAESVSTAPPGPPENALENLLPKMNHPVQDWRGSFIELKPDVKAIFVIEPDPDLSAQEAEALLAWAEKGGTVFVAPVGSPALESAISRWVEIANDPTQANEVPGDRIVPHEKSSWRYREVSPEERVQFKEQIKEIAFPGSIRVTDPSGQQSILFAREAMGLVAEIVHGDGNLIVFPEREMLSDEGLASATNASLLESLIEEWVPAGATVWIAR
jgi:Domain of unknown function (DUF4350)